MADAQSISTAPESLGPQVETRPGKDVLHLLR